MKIRASLSGRSEEQPPDPNEQVVNPVGKKQKQFFKDLKAMNNEHEGESGQKLNDIEVVDVNYQSKQSGKSNIHQPDPDPYDQANNLMMSKGAKSVNFADHNEEISVNTASVYDKQSEFKGYSKYEG